MKNKGTSKEKLFSYFLKNKKGQAQANPTGNTPQNNPPQLSWWKRFQYNQQQKKIKGEQAVGGLATAIPEAGPFIAMGVQAKA